MRIIRIGEGFFFLIFFNMKAIATKIAKMRIPLTSGANPPLKVVMPSSVLESIVTAVARIKAITHGRTPPRNA